MYSVVLLFLAMATAGPDAPSTIEWTVRGVSHSLEVQSEEDGSLALTGREGEYLRSVVGPLLSTLHRKTWTGEAGTYRTLKISTEMQGRYPFDLVSWIDESGQSGMVLRQMLDNSTCDFDGKCGAPQGRWPARPQCPSPGALAAYDGGFVEMSRLLIDAHCFAEEQVRLQPESFWVDDWDGSLVTLAVQREHCEASTSACDGRITFVKIRPPRVWNGWLEDAAAGRGYLPRALATAHNAGPVKAPVSEPQPQSVPAPAPAPVPAPGADTQLPVPPATPNPVP